MVHDIKPNELLSIAIPTYNRAAVLKKQLIDLIEKVRPHDIAIYISDNASPDNTQSVIEEMKAKYQFLYSSRNETNLGFDRNFEKVLKMSNSQYTWLFGDDDTIDDGGIEKVLEILDKDISYDAVVVNGINYDKTKLRKSHLETKVYTSHNDLLEDLWHAVQWISTLIINKNIIDKANFCKYYDTNFIHAGIIFDQLASKDIISVFWEERAIVIPPKEDEIINPHEDRHLLFYIKCTTDLFLLLPDRYSYQLRLRLIRKFSMSFFTLALFRVKNYFNYKEAKKYRKYFKYITIVPFSVIVVLSIMPIIFLKLLEKPARFVQKTISAICNKVRK